MAVSRSAKTTSSRGARAQAVDDLSSTHGQSGDNESSVEPNLTSVSEEESMTQAVDPVVETKAPKTQSKPQSAAIQLHQQPSLTIWNRPVMASDFEIAGTIQDGGIRPIGASHLNLYGTILNGRPIMSSELKVFQMLPGARPIFYSDIHMVESEGLPGSRPVMVSDPALLNASTLPGNRPIASNDIDDAPNLMGFID